MKPRDGAVDLGTITYQFSTGATTTREYDSGDISIPIPDGDPNGVEIPISVADAISLADVNVSVRLNHTFATDLVISVIHPDGTEVPLAFHEGNGGQNYGEGANDCSGTPTVFDDQASIPIGESRGAPFVGTFIPESPLSALNGKPSSGTWKLKVVDPWPGDAGTVGCVKLQLTSAPICCGPIINAVPPAIVTAASYSPANGAPDPGERVTVSLPLSNSGTSLTTNLVATLLATGGVTAPTGPQTYGTLQANGTPVARRFSFTANGNCGDTINLTLALQNGTTSLGTVAFRMRLGTAADGTPASFSNTRPIIIPGSGSGASSGAPANPYPSNIKVLGVSGPQAKMTVTLKNIAHTFPSDIDVLLVSPAGRGFLLMSDALGGADLTGQTYTFDDAAPALLPLKPATAPPSGSYKPANYDTPDAFHPRPPRP